MFFTVPSRARLTRRGALASARARRSSRPPAQWDAGRLAAIGYPHGRIVTYTYGTGGSADRVASVWMSLTDAGTQLLASGIDWEPWGGLRGYQLAFGAGDAGSVEYMLGDVSSDLPASQYRRYQEGALPRFTPLRFPGQYYDEETDLNENWHRYYDFNTGRYLSVEPRHGQPLSLVSRALEGGVFPVFSYARNNPLFYFDNDGLEDREKKCTAGEEECSRQGRLAHEAWCDCVNRGGTATLVDAFDAAGCKWVTETLSDGDVISSRQCDVETTRIQGISCDSTGPYGDEAKCSGPGGMGRAKWFRSTPTDLAHFFAAGGVKCSTGP